jgi:hypothetical protein
MPRKPKPKAGAYEKTREPERICARGDCDRLVTGRADAQYCSRTCAKVASQRRHSLPPGLSGRLCECGCGQRTTIIRRTIAVRGLVAGEAYRFLPGHNNARHGEPRWIEDALGCWVWQRSTNAGGYGQMKNGRLAHRALYIERVGPVPGDYDLHHRCGVRACVNPAHLESIPRGDHTALHNSRRGRDAA